METIFSFFGMLTFYRCRSGLISPAFIRKCWKISWKKYVTVDDCCFPFVSLLKCGWLNIVVYIYYHTYLQFDKMFHKRTYECKPFLLLETIYYCVYSSYNLRSLSTKCTQHTFWWRKYFQRISVFILAYETVNVWRYCTHFCLLVVVFRFSLELIEAKYYLLESNFTPRSQTR